MPNSMLDIDTNFPTFTEGQSTDAKLASVQNYLYMLVEQLRYSLRNLDLTNWNSSALAGFTGSITGPIYGRIEDAEGRMNRFQADAEGLRGRLSDAEGHITQLQADAEGLSGRISDAEGNITALQADAEGMRGRISDAEGNITSLSARAEGLETRVGNAEGSISSLQQSAEAITSRVSDAEGRLSDVEQTAGSITQTVGELGGRFSKVEQTVDGWTYTDPDGTTKVKGSSIETGSLVLTGSITWSDLNSSVQSSINNRGISEATARSIASTEITSTLVSSPTIKGADIIGGKFWELNERGQKGDTWLEIGQSGTGWGGMILKNTESYGGTQNEVFSVFNGDGWTGTMSWKSYTFIQFSSDEFICPRRTWDFSNATVVNFTPKFT